MSVTYIPVELRRAVILRAEKLCEYCFIHEDDTFFGCQVDHIIAEKHGGETSFDNLALACTNCNRAKGSVEIRTKVNYSRAAQHPEPRKAAKNAAPITQPENVATPKIRLAYPVSYLYVQPNHQDAREKQSLEARD